MNQKLKGILLSGLGGSLWGVSGIFAQLLFSDYQASSEWLVSTRLTMAGLLILTYSSILRKDPIFSIFKNKKHVLQLLLFSLVGMVGVQYLFFKAIEVSSASLATILQFTAPIFVYLYTLISREKKLYATEFALVLATFFGVLLIVTNGQFSKMSVSLIGFTVGIGSAVAVAFYSIQPRKILAVYGSPMIVGWGMLIGGLVFQFIQPFWQPSFSLTTHSVLLLTLIIVFGTAVAFIAYLASLSYIDPSLASIMTALEPLLAAVLSVVVFKQQFGVFELIGIAVVLVSVLLLSRYKPKNKVAETLG
ncbi:MAG TPA: DMT family transporter [Candidatus Jeotgalibaca merdavium]|uniref:DMT family transporter n=1 Tax=Candidatus Jeotgalibaca merdavium TaxID=2838627 RepID=A0A9D2I0B2_9LACT|nr:DMT family transporter [Candidatus Jeotgalibaca merdavium]